MSELILETSDVRLTSSNDRGGEYCGYLKCSWDFKLLLFFSLDSAYNF